jgi:carbon storage regulator
MLVLTRSTGESIIIDNNIVINIIEMRGSCVKVGIVAPKEVSVLRNELLEKHGKLSHKKTQCLTTKKAV